MTESNGSHSWIRPLLSQLDLLHQTEVPAKDPASLWDELTKSTLLDRLRQLPSLINQEAGYPLLNVQWFLPPQKVVCTFTVRKDTNDCGMQLVLRQAGPTLVFYTKKKGREATSYGLYRYLTGSSINVKHRRVIRPAAVTDRDLQEWFSYLLSGFQESFQPPRH